MKAGSRSMIRRLVHNSEGGSRPCARRTPALCSQHSRWPTSRPVRSPPPLSRAARRVCSCRTSAPSSRRSQRSIGALALTTARSRSSLDPFQSATITASPAAAIGCLNWVSATSHSPLLPPHPSPTRPQSPGSSSNTVAMASPSAGYATRASIGPPICWSRNASNIKNSSKQTWR